MTADLEHLAHLVADTFAAYGLNNGDPQHPQHPDHVMPWARLAVRALADHGALIVTAGEGISTGNPHGHPLATPHPGN